MCRLSSKANFSVLISSLHRTIFETSSRERREMKSNKQAKSCRFPCVLRVMADASSDRRQSRSRPDAHQQPQVVLEKDVPSPSPTPHPRGGGFLIVLGYTLFQGNIDSSRAISRLFNAVSMPRFLVPVPKKHGRKYSGLIRGEPMAWFRFS